MKRLVLALIFALLLLSSAANAYVVQAIAQSELGTHFMSAVTFGGWDHDSTIPHPPAVSTTAEVDPWDGVTPTRYRRYLFTNQPDVYHLRLLAHEDYRFESIWFTMWAPEATIADPQHPWTLWAGDVELWHGVFFDATSNSTQPKISIVFDFATWGDLRETPLDLVFEPNPEPSSIVALFCGFTGLGFLAWRKRS